MTVTNVAPTVNAGAATATINAGGTFSQAGSFTDPGVDAWEATVNYGDGSAVQPLTLTGKSFTLGHIYASAGAYTVTVTVTETDAEKASGQGTVAVTVNAVNAAPTVTTQPENQTVAVGGTATFTAAASGTPAPTVQWQTRSNPAGVFADITGATNTTLTITPVTVSHNGRQYRAVFTNSAGTATSIIAYLEVASAPVVTTQPVDQTVAAGGVVNFTSLGSGSPTPTVQWQVLPMGGAWADIAGANSTFLSFTTAVGDNGKQYRAVFTNPSGTATSNAATLSVTVINTAPTVDAGIDETLNEGGTVSRTGSFADPDTNAWTATVNYGDSSGTQVLALNPDKTFSVSHVYADNGAYTVTVSVSDGTATGTDTIAVMVNNVAPVVEAGADTATISAGGTFSRSGSFTDAGTDIWTATVNYGDGTGVQALSLSQTAKTFSLSHVYAAAGAYTVTVAVSDDEAASGSDSVAVTVEVPAPAPSVTTQPTTQTALVGQVVTFTAAATGSPTPTVQWQLSTDNGATWTNIRRATSTTYTLTAQLPQNGYQYRAVFANSGGSVATDAATLTINTAAADLLVTDSGPASVSGGQIDWTVKVTNLGPDTARDVVLTIQPPRGVKFDSIRGAADYSVRGSKVIVRLGDLNSSGHSGDVSVVSIVVRATSPMTLTATATASTADPNPDNNIAIREVAW